MDKMDEPSIIIQALLMFSVLVAIFMLNISHQNEVEECFAYEMPPVIVEPPPIDLPSLPHIYIPDVIHIRTIKTAEAPTLFYPLTEEERKVVECLVEGESGNQSLEGRMLVAQCIYNACVQDGLTPSQVRKQYKYAGWSNSPSEKTKEAVAKVFDEGEMVVEDNILWFCTIKSSERKGSFHATQKLVLEEGNHRFYSSWEGDK